MKAKINTDEFFIHEEDGKLSHKRSNSIMTFEDKILGTNAHIKILTKPLLLKCYPRPLRKIYKNDIAHIWIHDGIRTIEKPDGFLFMFRITNSGTIIKTKCDMKKCSYHDSKA